MSLSRGWPDAELDGDDHIPWSIGDTSQSLVAHLRLAALLGFERYSLGGLLGDV